MPWYTIQTCRNWKFSEVCWFGQENEGLHIKSLDIDVISQPFYFTLRKCVEIGVVKCQNAMRVFNIAFNNVAYFGSIKLLFK